MSPVMIGRVGPLTRLQGLVAAADVASGDEPSIGLVSGEPGIGKTRLVSEFVCDPAGPGNADITARVEVIRSQPGSIDRPFDTAGPLRKRLGIDDGVDLETAVTDVYERWLLEGPAVLVVEDVHWIDSDSAALVDLLGRQPWSGLVIVCTYRAGALRRGSPGGELVARLERNLTAEQTRLERLDRLEVGALVSSITGEQPTSALVDAVLHRSEGIPFVVEELVRAVRPGKAGDESSAEAISSAALPWSLSDAVRQQLSGLTDDQRTVVEGLAVLDDIASFETIQAVCELEAASLTAALRDLVGDGVLDEVTDDRFWFAHALMAETVSSELLGRERRRLHARCLVALEAEATASDGRRDYAALVRHAISAGRFDDVANLARMGARASLDAGQTFLALRLASQGLDEECDDPELLAIATEAAWRLDFLDEAADHAGRWVTAAEGVARADALRMESRISFERYELDLAEAALARLVSLAEDGDEPVAIRAAAEAALAQLYMYTHRSAEAVQWADRAIVHAGAAGDEVSAARAGVERASARAWLVPRAEAEVELRAAIGAARAASDFVSTARGLGNLLTIVPPHTLDGRQIVEELRLLVRRAGFDKLGAVVATRSCDAAIGLGDLPAARRALAESWSSWMPAGAQYLASLEAQVAIEEGRFADAESILSSVSAPGEMLAERLAVNDDPFHVPVLWLLLGALRGDRDIGARAFEALVSIKSEWSFFFDDLIIAVDAALAVGVESGRVREGLVKPIIGRRESNLIEDTPSYAEGLLAVGERRFRDAIALLEPLVGGDTDVRVGAIPRAVARLALARADVAIGDRQRALGLVYRVLDEDLAKWPGVRRDRAEEMLRRLEPVRADADSRVSNAADAGPGGSLTPREREVAELLSEGLTNGQLAERLYISPKTAAVHVSNILAKLDLSSRAEIAAWAVRNLGEPVQTQ